MIDIFISYSRKDREKVRSLVKLFEKQNWSVFWDQEILPGEKWSVKIQSELKAAKSVVVVWSKQSVESDWIAEEAEIAKKRGILVPIKIDEVETPFGFGNIQFVEFNRWPPSAREPELGRLLHALAELINKPVRELKPELGREDVSFDKLNQAVKTQKFNEIMKRYQSLIAARPEDGEAHFSLALCFLHLKQFDRAEAHFKRSTELLADDADTYYYYGLSLIQGKRPKTLSLKEVRRIEEYLDTAMQLDDRPAKYYYLSAILKYDYYLANGLTPSPPSHHELISLARQKDHDRGEIERLLQGVTLRDDAIISNILGE